jgi:hypothetical protein
VAKKRIFWARDIERLGFGSDPEAALSTDIALFRTAENQFSSHVCGLPMIW